MALTAEQIKRDIGEIQADLHAREAKYIRNYNRYVNNQFRRDSLHNIYNPPQGYWYNSIEPDTGPVPIVNVLRSMVNTLDSKIAQTKVRPFFNPVNGLWTTRKFARVVQQFFDMWFDKEHFYIKKNLCRRDASVFDTGVMRINEEKLTVERIPIWQYFFDRSEMAHGEMSRCFFHDPKYPIAYLRNVEWATDSIKAKYERAPFSRVELTTYYDLYNKKRWHIVDGEIQDDDNIDFDKEPAVVTYNTPPVKGAYTTSLIDNQYPTQAFLDMLVERIELAVELNPASTTFLPQGSDIKKSMWSNEVGAVYEYRPSPLVNGLPVVLTPPAISDQYIQIFNLIVETMYNQEGISQLSAESKKPSGLNSGVALQTVQDVESDRFQSLIDEDEEFSMKITERCIDVFPKDANLLPEMTGRSKVNWSDIQKQRKNFSIQFAAASALSKDPMVKMQQIEKLIAMKVIPPDQAPEYLEFPDLEKVESKMTAVQDVVEAIIERAVEDHNFEYDEVVPGNVLEQAVLVELYHLDAVDDNQKEIENLREFYAVVRKNNNAMEQIMNAQNQPAPQQQAPGPVQTPAQPPVAPGPTGELPAEAPQQLPPQMAPQPGGPEA